jgi:cation transport ATPase
MRKTSLWNLYVAAYTLIFGLPLLLFPNLLFSLGFEQIDELWARLTGMFLLGFSYVNVVICLKRPGPMIRALMVTQACFAVGLGILALMGNPPLFYLMGGIMLIGVIGAALTYRAER